jgi:L-alanine-DL-glutamate epimerase-like enolase superfamily enzyme
MPTPDADGVVDLPEGPGLGYEFDWTFIENNRVTG